MRRVGIVILYRPREKEWIFEKIINEDTFFDQLIKRLRSIKIPSSIIFALPSRHLVLKRIARKYNILYFEGSEDPFVRIKEVIEKFNLSIVLKIYAEQFLLFSEFLEHLFFLHLKKKAVFTTTPSFTRYGFVVDVFNSEAIKKININNNRKCSFSSFPSFKEIFLNFGIQPFIPQLKKWHFLIKGSIITPYFGLSLFLVNEQNFNFAKEVYLQCCENDDVDLIRLSNLLHFYEKIFNARLLTSPSTIEHVERILPEFTDVQEVKRHYERYKRVKELCKQTEKILDVGCGVGYGSDLLAERAKLVVGQEIDENVCRFARKRYKKDNLHFLVSKNVCFHEEVFDIVCCLEVIEHIKERDTFLFGIKKSLRKEGIFIITTPNKKELNGDYENPFHVCEFEEQDLVSLLRRNFTNIKIFRLNQRKDLMAICIQTKSSQKRGHIAWR